MRGDHVVVHGAGGVHHGVDVGDGRVIHCEEPSGPGAGDPIIRYAAFEEFAPGNIGEAREHRQRLSVDETVERAKSRLGERCPDGDQGEDFALWCVTGRTPDRPLTGSPSLGAAGAAGPENGLPDGFVPGIPRSLFGAGTADAGAGRERSLRREWSRGFVVLLVLLILAGAGSVAGIQKVMDHMQGTIGQLQRESESVAALRTAMIAHEQAAQQLLSGNTVDKAAFLEQQQQILDLFEKSPADFPAASDAPGVLGRAARTWQDGLSAHGLWGSQVQGLNGSHAPEIPAFAASSDAARELLNRLHSASIDAMNEGAAYGTHLEQALVVFLIAVFVSALAVTVYFRRRMLTDLMGPVDILHQGVLRLQAGDYNYRINVPRRDELGELAGAFNTMAEALHKSYLALTRRATQDPLTGLANRAAVSEQLNSLFAPEGPRQDPGQSLLFIDVDDFKDINDSLGHEGGDALLISLAARLKGCVRSRDVVARLGGDEFAVIITAGDGSTAGEIAERILRALNVPFLLNGHRVTITVSIGVAHKHSGIHDAAELLRQADFAMYMAKGSGKARYQLFDSQMYNQMAHHASLRADLAQAVPSGQLRLDYQPVADLNTGAILGVEALVRWDHPVLGLLPPQDFIPLAEETGDIDAIGCWVLETAAREGTRWRQSVEGCDNLWVAVNLSTLQLPNPKNLAAIKAILDQPQAQADRLVLEVTETALATSADGGITALTALKECGVRIAIDDFGTGYSSLSTLAALPADILKIDQSFLARVTSDPASLAMLEGILGLAGKLRLDVIAEGIEEPEHIELLRRLGAHMGQGYLLARPAPAQTIQTLLASGQPLRTDYAQNLNH